MSDESEREPSPQESDHRDDLVGGAWEEEEEEEEEDEEERRPPPRSKAGEREVSTRTSLSRLISRRVCGCLWLPK